MLGPYHCYSGVFLEELFYFLRRCGPGGFATPELQPWSFFKKAIRWPENRGGQIDQVPPYICTGVL